MKKCAYCGRENDDEALHCQGCGTEFKTPAPETAPNNRAPAAPAWKFSELTPEDMKLNFVTLITCGTLLEADIIAGRLGSAGITAFIPDEFLSQAVSWHLNTYGYVRVQVSPKDYEAAKTFLLDSVKDAEPGGISD
jgi:hypothetical protein